MCYERNTTVCSFYQHPQFLLTRSTIHTLLSAGPPHSHAKWNRRALRLRASPLEDELLCLKSNMNTNKTVVQYSVQLYEQIQNKTMYSIRSGHMSSGTCFSVLHSTVHHLQNKATRLLWSYLMHALPLPLQRHLKFRTAKIRAQEVHTYTFLSKFAFARYCLQSPRRIK